MYYTHPGARITTDIDLADARRLRAVATYLDRKIPHEMNVPPAGWEVWLRNESVRHGELVPVRCWVNHDARTLSYSPPTEDGASVNGDRAYS